MNNEQAILILRVFDFSFALIAFSTLFTLCLLSAGKRILYVGVLLYLANAVIYSTALMIHFLMYGNLVPEFALFWVQELRIQAAITFMYYGVYFAKFTKLKER